MSQRIYANVVALQKAGETFVFCFEDEDSDALISTMARFAADPDINFGWSDFAVLICQVPSIDSYSGENESRLSSHPSTFEEEDRKDC